MKAWRAVMLAFAVAGLSAACDATTRHKILSAMFDGVPPLKAGAAETKPGPAPAVPFPARQAEFTEHGPYAAKLCNACHQEGLGNALVAPRDQLCFRCHEFGREKKYVHGPLASGGCLVCHDPHSSRYPHLLVSESDGFCFHCHDRETIQRIQGHPEVGERCTACHDAHMSDTKFLLK